MIKMIPTLFAINRYSLHDGPHIRTTIFLKGCPLSCRWCHNPEGIAREIEILSVRNKCIGCGECAELCPAQALRLDSQGICRDRKRCSGCGICVDCCPALVHESTGWQTDVLTVMAEIRKDLPFFDQSGGGVTFSGGEPLMQPAFLIELLKACGDLQIHRTVDTSGFAPTETLLDVARYTELFLYDLKHMENRRHKEYTGVGNELILDNLATLCRAGHKVRVRIPLVAGFNDDETNIQRAAGFLAALPGIEGIDLLPYHGIGRGKYQKLAQDYPGANLTAPDPLQIAATTKLLESYGLHVRLGG